MAKASILVVDDEKGQRELLVGYLVKEGFSITEAGDGEEALKKYADNFSPVALIDMKMPGMSGIELLEKLKELNPFIQVLVLTAFGSVETAVSAMRAGAFDYLTKPIEDLQELLLKLNKAFDQNRLITEHQLMSDRLNEVFPDTEILGKSASIQRVRELIAKVAPGDATVLITGPSGTGKELVARAIHAMSPRADKKLVAINCASFPENLLESELFGYEKGAFTGADKAKPGRFELAVGGTLFLDEIAEMPLSMQVKLLRVLEEKTIQRLGAVREIVLDIRILTATNRDLEKMVAEGRFREDLFYRINVVRIDNPPLRQRGGDILLLAEKFLKKFAHKAGRDIQGISPEAAAILSQYHWPGNVRELENIMERAVVLSDSTALTAADLVGLANVERPSGEREVKPLAVVEKDHIQYCLDQLDWNLGLCAERLEIHRNTLRAKIKEYGLTRGQL